MMQLTFTDGYIEPGAIRGCWRILNPFLGWLIDQGIEYRVCTSPAAPLRGHAVFYIPGLGGLPQQHTFPGRSHLSAYPWSV